MKKSLHGRRYLRSRSTVQIGRLHRKIKKLTIQIDRATKAIGALDFSWAFTEMGKAISRMGDEIKKFADFAKE